MITEKKDPPIDAKEWEGVENKFRDHFSEKPEVKYGKKKRRI